MIGRFNSDLSYSFALMQSKPLLKSSNNKTSTARNSASFDTFTLSGTDKIVSMISSLRSIGGTPLVDLKAKNNVLTFDRDTNYQVDMGKGKSFIFSQDPSIWEHVKNELGLEELKVESLGYCEKMEKFVADLRLGHEMRDAWLGGYAIDYYAKLGIKPGFVTVDNQPSGKGGTLFLTDDGYSANGEAIESMRKSFATKDYRLEGCTEESVLTVNGKEYKMDEDGHFNIPYGEPVVWYYKNNDINNPNIIMPKEIGEWRRAQSDMVMS
ncbi:hypothetical protein FACS1894120_5380 [Clostridia bacterium]|nr:hypothetical protein FACS1894120_5380 [Clostridia bacterium]